MSKMSGSQIMCASYYSLLDYCTAQDKFMSTFLETTYGHTPCNNNIELQYIYCEAENKIIFNVWINYVRDCFD